MNTTRGYFVWSVLVALGLFLPAALHAEAGEKERGNLEEREDDDDDDEMDDEIEGLIRGLREAGRDDGRREIDDDDRVPDIDVAGGVEKAVARLDRQIGDLKNAKVELARHIAARKKEIEDAPKVIEPAKAKLQAQAPAAAEQRRAAAEAAGKALLAEKEAVEARAKALAKQGDDEVGQIENEVEEVDRDIEKIAEPVRRALGETAAYKFAREAARVAEVRLAAAKERQQAGRPVGPRELVDAINEADRTRREVEALELEKLLGRDDFRAARAKLSEVKARLSEARKAQAKRAAADPAYAAALAAAKAARDEQRELRKQIAEAGRAKEQAAATVVKAIKQVKLNEADLAKLEAAGKVIDARLKAMDEQRQALVKQK